jgi:hypothetical protein
MKRTTLYWWLRMISAWLGAHVVVLRLSRDVLLAVSAATLLGSFMNWAEVTFRPEPK